MALFIAAGKRLIAPLLPRVAWIALERIRDRIRPRAYLLPSSPAAEPTPTRRVLRRDLVLIFIVAFGIDSPYRLI